MRINWNRNTQMWMFKELQSEVAHFLLLFVVDKKK